MPTGAETQLPLLPAIVLAIVQGITELFPISSLGHAVILPYLVGWTVDQEAFLPFLVMLHLGTATALLLYFWQDWRALLLGLMGAPSTAAAAPNRRVLLLVVAATIPAGLLGLLLEKRLALLFGRPQAAALFLALNGIVLLAGEWLRKRQRSRDVTQLSLKQAVGIGAFQAIALLPGFSRSGAAMVGGLVVGLTHEAAAHFAFLLATPIIFAAGLLEVPKLLQPALRPALPSALLAGLVAGVVAYLSTWFLMRYFKSHEVNALLPFAIYCMAAGLGALLLS